MLLFRVVLCLCALFRRISDSRSRGFIIRIYDDDPTAAVRADDAASSMLENGKREAQ